MAQSPKERRSPPSPSKSPAKAEASANWEGTTAKPATGMRGEVKLALMLVMTLAGAFGYIVYRKFDAIQQVAAAEKVESLKFQPLKPRSPGVEEVQLSAAPDQAEPPFADAGSSREADKADVPWSNSTTGMANVAASAPTGGDHPFLASSTPQAPVQSEPNAFERETFDPGQMNEPGPSGNTEPQPLALSETRLIAASDSLPSRQENSPSADPFLPAKPSVAEDIPSDLFAPATTPARFPADTTTPAKSAESPAFVPAQEELEFPTPPREELPFRPAEPSDDVPFAPADTPAQPAAMPQTAERSLVADSGNPFAPVTIAPATEPVVPQPARPAEPSPFATAPAAAEPAAMTPVTAAPAITASPAGEADVPFAPATFPSEPAPVPATLPLVESSLEPRPLPRLAASSPLTESIATPAAAFTPSYEPAPAMASPPAFSTEQFYTVRPGDNYWSISRNLYGTSRYFNALTEYNRERIPDPSRMQPGSQVAAPPRELLEQRYPDLCGIATTAAAPAVVGERGQFFVGPGGQPQYRVGQGDTLTGIAQKHLGRGSRWTTIFEMNRDVLPTADTLKPGTILKLPPDASQVALTPEGAVGR